METSVKPGLSRLIHTELLSKLTALTQKDEKGLLPCICGMTASLEEVDFRGDSEGPYSVTCSYRRHHETQWHDTPEMANDEWNNRPREAAFIALVQEAAGEIERLREALKKSNSQLIQVHSDIDDRKSAFANKLSRLIDENEKALNPQKPTS